MKSKYQKENLEKIISASASLAEVIRKINNNVVNSGIYITLKKYIKLYEIDTSHFLGQAHLKNKSHNWAKGKPLNDILVQDSSYNRYNLKRRLLKSGTFDYKCAECGIESWNNKPLSLQLDHINGLNNDNRIENLRLLCPNCHSQTSTFCRGQKFTNFRSKKFNLCNDCSTQISRYSIRCKDCDNKRRKANPKTKIIWPQIEKLKEMVEQSSYLAVSRQLGVSDQAVHKHIKNHS